jgi:hypothetical protein
MNKLSLFGFTRRCAKACALALSVASLASCGGDSEECTTGSDSRTMNVVVSAISFVKHNADRTIEGFDVDNVVTTGIFPDPSGCGLADSVSSTGQQGIDNNLSLTFETIDNLTNGAVDGLLKMAIEQGTLLIIWRMEGVDDLVNDPCVSMSMLKGAAGSPPLIGTNGYLAPAQTFGVDATTPISHFAGRIENGVLYAGPFEGIIPLQIFGVSANIRIHDAQLRGVINETGGLGELGIVPTDGGVLSLGNAMVGGGIEVEQVLEIARIAGEMDHNAAMIASSADVFLRSAADLNFDGNECTQISAALHFRSEPAFLLGDPIE